MVNTVVSIIPLHELEEKFAKVVEDRLKAFLQPEVNNNTLTEYLTRKEVSERLRISLPTLNTLTKEGALKGYRIGGRVLYKWAEVTTMLDEIATTKYKRKSISK